MKKLQFQIKNNVFIKTNNRTDNKELRIMKIEPNRTILEQAWSQGMVK